MTDASKIDVPNLFETMLAAADAAKTRELIALDDGRRFVALPKSFEMKDVTDPRLAAARLPIIPEARVTVDEKQALIDYVNRFGGADTVVFADVDKGCLEAVIDWHAAGAPGEPCASGARRHVATLSLRRSEEFTRWDAAEGEWTPQDEFARFLEENAGDIVEPEAADMIEIARDLSASTGGQFRSKIDLTSGDRVFTYTKETTVEERLRVPRGFVLAIPIYQGEAPMSLNALFRFRVAGDKGLHLAFEWRRVRFQELALFRQIAHDVADATGKPVYLGRAV